MGIDLNELKNQMMGGGKKEKKEFQKKSPKTDKSNHMTPVSAPYNFVPFSDQVYEYKDGQLTGHQEMNQNLFTGEILYEVEAHSPVFVDDGTGNFHTTAKGEYSLPGSTMRGLIRNNVQILGLSSLSDDVEDYMLMYRNVAKGAEKVRYGKILGADQIPILSGDKTLRISILKKVKAGYVKKERGKYQIYQTCKDVIDKSYGDMNYYILSERKVVDEYLKSKKYGSEFRYEFFIKNGKSRMQHQMKPFVKENRNGRIVYKGVENKEYRPFFDKISYEIEGVKNVSAVGVPGTYKHSGYVLSSGKMSGKKVIYIIPEISYEKEVIELKPGSPDLRAFQIDLEKRKKTLKQFGGYEFFDLPQKENEIKPVFYIYIKEKDKTYFGFTPRLRLLYDHTIKEGLKQQHKNAGLDYCKSMFGYTGKNKSYKSRVSFSDAVLSKDQGVSDTKTVILSEPKPTSYLDYLQQMDGKTTYNTNGFELRGEKQYWLHNRLIETAVSEKQEMVASTLKPLNAGAVFIGKIRFHNLTKDELGLLLWSVTLNDHSWMNIGKAKAYGYGAISIKLLEVKRLDLQTAYDITETLALDPFVPVDVKECVQCYKDKINEFLGGSQIDELPWIQDFFIMKDSTRIPDNKKTGYMSLEQYGKRSQKLPDIRQIAPKKK